MSKSIRTLLATAAGITIAFLTFVWVAKLLRMLLLWMAGNESVFQEIYRGFDDDPIFWLVRIAAGLYLGFVAYRISTRFLNKHGVPGLLAPPSLGVNAQPINLHVYVNGQDETGQLARLEVFNQQVPAARLQDFYWSEGGKPLVIKGANGLYLVLMKTAKSPYEADNSSDEPSIAVKVRTRTKILHTLESV